MHINKCYKYNENGVIKVSENLPENATILEEMDILYAEEGYELVRKSDNENVSNSIWLKDGDVQNNYIEIKELQSEQ